MTWEDPNNWTPVAAPPPGLGGAGIGVLGGPVFQVPGPGDDVTIGMPNINIVINANESVNSLNFTSAAGVITGTGSLTTGVFTFNALNASFMTNADLTVDLDFTWITGTLGGTGNLNLTGTSTINSGGAY
jgi:hypothetical protein